MFKLYKFKNLIEMYLGNYLTYFASFLSVFEIN